MSWLEKCKLAPMSRVPDEFIPHLGLMVVQHAFMDSCLESVIEYLSKQSSNPDRAMASTARGMSAKVEVLKKLSKETIDKVMVQRKMLVLAELIAQLNNERNTLVHSLPGAYSPTRNELIHFSKSRGLVPKFGAQKPYAVTTTKINELSRNMELVGIWLAKFMPTCLPDGVEFDEALLERHPDWYDDSQFPWHEELQRTIDG